eukprot:13661733-Alexandrium_andersonii.AAC.1
MATNPRPSATPLATTASSASPALKATVFWAVDPCFMARVPRVRTPPRVDLRARKHPAKIRVNVRAESGPL